MSSKQEKKLQKPPAARKKYNCPKTRAEVTVKVAPCLKEKTIAIVGTYAEGAALTAVKRGALYVACYEEAGEWRNDRRFQRKGAERTGRCDFKELLSYELLMEERQRYDVVIDANGNLQRMRYMGSFLEELCHIAKPGGVVITNLRNEALFLDGLEKAIEEHMFRSFGRMPGIKPRTQNHSYTEVMDALLKYRPLELKAARDYKGLEVQEVAEFDKDFLGENYLRELFNVIRTERGNRAAKIILKAIKETVSKYCERQVMRPYTVIEGVKQ